MKQFHDSARVGLRHTNLLLLWGGGGCGNWESGKLQGELDGKGASGSAVEGW